MHAEPAAEAAPGASLAAFAAAEAARAAAAAGQGYETPAGGVSPSRLLLPEGSPLLEEDEGSTADLLSPGGF